LQPISPAAVAVAAVALSASLAHLEGPQQVTGAWLQLVRLKVFRQVVQCAGMLHQAVLNVLWRFKQQKFAKKLQLISSW
jgi:hypothetical protein